MNACTLEPSDDTTWYLAGPMSGLPQHNFPAFESAADELRARGCTIISPAELEHKRFRQHVMADMTGESTNVTGNGISIDGCTPGMLLARDIELIVDRCSGIIFLPDWFRSRGARLEATAGLLFGLRFAVYVEGEGAIPVPPQAVLTKLSKHTHQDIRNAAD